MIIGSYNLTISSLYYNYWPNYWFKIVKFES